MTSRSAGEKGVGKQLLFEERCQEATWTAIRMTPIWLLGRGPREHGILPRPSSASPSGVPQGSICFGKGREEELAGVRASYLSGSKKGKSQPGLPSTPFSLLPILMDVLTLPLTPPWERGQKTPGAGEREKTWTAPGCH